MEEKSLKEKLAELDVTGENSIEDAMNPVVDARLNRQIGMTLEEAGVEIDFEGLEADIDNVTKTIRSIKIVSVVMFLLCVGLFIGRFIL